MNQNREKDNSIYIYAAALLASLGLTFLFIFKQPAGVSEKGQGGFYFLLLPMVSIFAGLFTQGLIHRFFSGDLALILERVFKRLGWGIAAFFFAFCMPEAEPMNMLAYGVLFLTVLLTLNCLTLLVKHYVVLSRVFQALLFLLQGFAVRMIVMALLPKGVWESLGIGVSVADMAFAGFFVMFLCKLFSLSELSSNHYFKAAGGWVEKSYPLEFLFACIAVFIFKDIRNFIRQNFSQDFIMGEWIFVFVLLTVASVIVIRQIQYSTKIIPHKDLKKHIQEIKFNKGTDLREVTNYIDEFIYRGEKSNIVTFMTMTAYHSDIPHKMVGNILKPLIECKDMPVPSIFLRSELRMIEEYNIENRKQILEDVITKVKYYRRNRYE